MQLRLDKFLADTGYGTRSAVKDMLKQGRVTVDGAFVKKPDIKVDPEKNVVLVDGKEASYESFEYYMLNKPAGVVSATEDKFQKTVLDLIKDKKRRDLFPVGRLDKDTEGLLLITNDGITCNKLLAPLKHVGKKYEAIIKGRVTEADVLAFKEGLDIGDDKPTKEAVLNIRRNYEEGDEDFSEIDVVITEGRYHQIKRMFEARGMEVVYLKRLSMGKLVLDDTLKPGEYRKLSEKEIELIIR